MILTFYESDQVPSNQCDQIGLFLKNLGNRFSTKVAQLLGEFWSTLKLSTVEVKTALATF